MRCFPEFVCKKKKTQQLDLETRCLWWAWIFFTISAQWSTFVYLTFIYSLLLWAQCQMVEMRRKQNQQLSHLYDAAVHKNLSNTERCQPSDLQQVWGACFWQTCSRARSAPLLQYGMCHLNKIRWCDCESVILCVVGMGYCVEISILWQTMRRERNVQKYLTASKAQIQILHFETS